MIEVVGLLWMIFQFVLFGLIGVVVRIEQIQDFYIVGKIWECYCYSGCYIWGCYMIQWLLYLGGGGLDNIVFVKIDILSFGDLCKVVFFIQRMCYKYCFFFLGFGVVVLVFGLLV